MRSAVVAAVLLAAAWPAAAGELIPFKRGSWQELRSQHQGEPLIVHLWALSCSPCLAELPVWAQLQRELPAVRIVLVNADRPGEKRQRILAALDKAGLSGIEAWAFVEEHVDRLRFEIDPDWLGELPRTLLIAADGGVSAHSGAMTLEELRGWAATGSAAALEPSR